MAIGIMAVIPPFFFIKWRHVRQNHFIPGEYLLLLIWAAVNLFFTRLEEVLIWIYPPIFLDLASIFNKIANN